MNPLLEQFLSEARDFLQGIGEKLMQLEDAPEDADLMVELFRFVHTLKGNSGLFEFPEMTRVLHAAEDLMDAVRKNKIVYSNALADELLDAMDYVGMLCDEIESTGKIDSSRAAESARLAEALRLLNVSKGAEVAVQTALPVLSQGKVPELPLDKLPETLRLEAYRRAMRGESLFWVTYKPAEECYFQGDDPFFNARHTPEILWGRVVASEPWPSFAELDAYRCVLEFHVLTSAPRSVLEEHYRYMPDQIHIVAVDPWFLVIPQGNPNGGPVYDDFVSDALEHLEAEDLVALKQGASTMLQLSNPDLWLSSALRWMLMLLECAPDNRAALRNLIESLLTLNPPDWNASGLIPAAESQSVALETSEDSTLVSVQPVDLPVESAEEQLTGTQLLESEALACRVSEETVSQEPLVQKSEIPELEVQNPVTQEILSQESIAEKSSLQKSNNLPLKKTPKKLSEDELAAIESIFEVQRMILTLDGQPAGQNGRFKAAAAALINCCKVRGDVIAQRAIEVALQLALDSGSSDPLLIWLDDHENDDANELSVDIEEILIVPDDKLLLSDGQLGVIAIVPAEVIAAATEEIVVAAVIKVVPVADTVLLDVELVDSPVDDIQQLVRRAEDPSANVTAKSLKVDQSKIDLLMNLIGEMVVSKNALPYLAQRAEEQYGVRELSREIKAQYAVINRIAEEMQDAIMQVRMMPVSFVFQRFPRLVRDLSRKLGKEVQLVLEGEDTEADKNIIESLADPLIHIVRNSLDHGLETPEVRRKLGKPASGTLTIRAVQEGDRVIIEIIDDGKGIDPAVVKQKAYEKGVIDEATLERISDRDAVNLVFAAGFSTVEVVSDLSGRGVGMDVVRTAVEKVNGSIVLDSEVGKGTQIRITLPLSMAVTNLMIIESDNQIFGVPMDNVVETVRVPCSAIRSIKQAKTAVLRGSIVPLKSLNTLLGLSAEPIVSADNEIAVLVARVGSETVGLIVDDFHETVDVIQKPLNGVLGGISAYSGSALMGDGSVLMVLNVKEIV